MSVNENIPVSKACIGLKDQIINRGRKKVYNRYRKIL